MQTKTLIRRSPDQSGTDVLISNVAVTQTVVERLRGLLGRPALQPDQGMWLESCNSIHTFFMRYPLDVVFIDRQQRVCHQVTGLKPWRFSGSFRATSVLELSAGQIEAKQIRLGDTLQWQD